MHAVREPAIAGETLLTLRQAARRFPGGHPDHPGRGLHVNTLRRWARDGIAGVRLRTVSRGGRVYTSIEELARFDAAVARARERLKVAPPWLARVRALRGQSERRRQRDYERAKAVNDAVSGRG